MPGGGDGELGWNLVFLKQICSRACRRNFDFFFGDNFRNSGRFRKNPELGYLRKTQNSGNFQGNPKLRKCSGKSQNSRNFQQNPEFPEISGKSRNSGFVPKNPEIREFLGKIPTFSEIFGCFRKSSEKFPKFRKCSLFCSCLAPAPIGR